MPTYLHPGVYIEELPGGAKPIEGVETAIAAFIGYANEGPLIDDEDDRPALITSYDEYEKRFGGRKDLPFEADDGSTLQDPMGHAVYSFFQNGGAKAYIARIASSDAERPLRAASDSLEISPEGRLLSIEAANQGSWGNDLRVNLVRTLTTDTANPRFTLQVLRLKDDSRDPADPDLEDSDFELKEQITDLFLRADDARFIEDVVEDQSKLVRVTLGGADGYGLEEQNALIAAVGTGAITRTFILTGGSDGAPPEDRTYDQVFTILTKIRDITIVLLPGKFWISDSHAVIDSAIAHCELMKSRMVIIDPPPTEELEAETDITDLGLPTQTYCALYYPWIYVPNPFYDADRNPGAERRVLVAPSSFAAGVWAKTDARRGVWKAPAGVETPLVGVSGFEYTIEDAEQDFLNPLGVNAIRKLPNYGSVIWGTRTLSTKANPEWRYVPVRRTAIFIEQSIYNNIQWAVFEPNDHRLWASLRATIESFMNGLFRSGAFQGEKASDAFFVRCGLGSTMTQDDIDLGQVIVLVGFAPVKPAEFVIVRIQQKVGQQ